MHAHLPHIDASSQAWVRGIALVLSLVTAPVVLAVIWLAFLRAIA